MNAMVQSLKEMGPWKVGVMALVSVILLSFFIFLAFRVSQPTLVPLYGDLSMEDSSKIINELESQGVTYNLRGDGSLIMVPADQVMRLRMKLAEHGMPGSGSLVGYEIFDRSEALGTSNFVHNVNLLRALEGELGRTISAFSHVEHARVHLVMPKRELFTRERREPSASVIVKMASGKQLSKEEINAVRYLIATAVPNLLPSRITIVDDSGQLLARGASEEDDPEAFAANAEEFRVSLERRLGRTVENLLEQTVGVGKVRATISADIDFDRVTTNAELYDPDSQVARSVQSIEENEQSSDKDLRQNVTVANNLPDANPAEAGILSQRTSQRTEETTNYEISKTIKNHISETGSINRLSVAVLVDGTYETRENEETGEEEEVYVPRSEEEIAQLTALVKSAVGFDASRGDTVEVINMQFSHGLIEGLEEGPLDWLTQDLRNMIETLVIAIVAIMFILMVVRPLVNRALDARREAEEEELAMAEALAAPGAANIPGMEGEGEEDDDLIDLAQIDGGVKSGTYRRINELIEKHPEETMAVLRQWMGIEE